MLIYKCKCNKKVINLEFKNQIKEYLEKSGGIITSVYCRENNIPTIYLTRFVRQGFLKKAANGIYLTEEGNFDEFYFFQYQYKKTIFSYETALYLMGVTDKIPQLFDVTVGNGYKFNQAIPKLNVHYVKKENFNIGVREVNTMFGNSVRVYSYERTLCDFISHKEKIDPEVYVKSLRSYSSYREKDIHYLYEIAGKMDIVDEVREIMEIAYG